jgi:hypothetical protein
MAIFNLFISSRHVHGWVEAVVDSVGRAGKLSVRPLLQSMTIARQSVAVLLPGVLRGDLFVRRYGHTRI